eukprot:352433_1
MTTDFLMEMPLTTDILSQMSTLKQLNCLQNEIELTNNLAPGFKNVKCGKIFYKKLKEYIHALESNIIDNLPQEPDKDNIHILCKACLFDNNAINKNAFHIIYCFTSKNLKNEEQINLLVNDTILFDVLIKFLSGNNNKLKFLAIECLITITYNGLNILNVDQLIPLLIKEINSNDFNIKTEVTKLISNLCHNDYNNQFKQILLEKNVLNALQCLHDNKYLSYTIMEHASTIIGRLCDQNQFPDTKYLPQILQQLQFMIFYDENQVIEYALDSYSELLEQNVDNKCILENWYVENETSKKKKKSTREKQNKTRKKDNKKK